MIVKEFFIGMAPATQVSPMVAYTKDITWNAIQVTEGGGGRGVYGLPWKWIGLGVGSIIAIIVAVKTRPKRKTT